MTVAPAPGMAALPMYVTAPYIRDDQRNPKHQPGRLVYSAQLDREKLMTYYKCATMPFCCSLEEMAKETSYDVYTHGVQLTRPSYLPADCCWDRPAWGLFTYYDHHVFDAPTSGGVRCNGNCFGFLAYLGWFGESLNHHIIGINHCRPSGLAMVALHDGCCQTVEQVYGLKQGEAARVSGIINEQVRLYRENPTNYAMDPLVQGSRMA